MKDKDKTHKQLITELTQLRQRIAELEATGRKRNQFEKSLRTERDKAQQYLDIAEVMLVVLDKKGSITLLNRKGNQILGYKEGELIGKNWFTTCLPTHLRKGVKGVFKKLMAGEGKQTEFYENPVLTKSGTERIIAWHNTVLQDTQGTIIGTLSSGEDITERKKAEEEIERLASFPQLNPMPIVEVDKKGQPTYTNPAAQQIFPDLEKKQGKHPFLDGLKSYFSELQKTPQKYLFREIEVDSGWYSQIISLADPEHIRIYAADITERKQAEDALREGEERFHRVVETMKVGLGTIDKNGVLTYVNEYLAKMLGYSIDEMIGRATLDFYYDEEMRKAQEEIFKKRRAGMRDPTPYEVTWRRKDGQKVYAILSPTPMCDADGHYTGSFAIHTDITERRRMEETLRESEEKYRELINGMNDTAWVIDFDGNFIDVNDAAVEVLGYSREELLAMGPHNIDSSLAAKNITGLIKGMRTDKLQVFETTHTTKTGKAIPVEIKSTLVTYQGKQAILSIARDITERKKADQALRESETRFRTLFEGIPDSVIVHDDEGNILHINEIGAERLEWTPKDLVGRNLREIVTPENAASIADHVRETHTLGWCRFETTYVSRSGWQIITEVIERPIKFGTVKAILSVAHDITERKQVEQALRESEEKYRAMFETAPVSIILLDKDGVIIDVSPYHYSHIGKGKVKRKDLVGKSILNHPTIVNAGLSEIYGRLFQGESFEQNNVYFPVLLPGGDGYFNVRGTPILRDGEVIGAVIMHEDITERKQAEDELRESKERFKIAAQSASDLVWEWDIPNGRLQWFGAIDELLGYAPGKFPRTIEAWEKHIHSDDHDRVMAALDQHLNDQTPYEKEYRVRRKDGTYRYWIDRGTARRDSKGNPLKMVGVCTDITERKRTEQELQESEERFRLAFESANTGVCLVDPEGNLTRVNSKMCEIFGYTKKELESMTVNDIAHPKNIDTSPTFMQKTLQGEIDRGTFEKRYIHKKGHVVICEVSSSLVRNAEGTPLYFISHVHDISARKQAEEALQHSYQQMQDMLVTTVNALASTVEMKDQYTAGHQPRVAQLACAIAEEMGLPEEQIEGIRMAGLIHDIGKIMVPAEILNKPGPLTEIQYEMVRMHPRAAFDILKGIKFPWPVAEAVLQHQELMDGSGYPQGLSGKEILLEARILAVANAVEAMVSHRPYRAAYDIKEALAEISKNKGTLYDPAVVDACLKLFAEKRFTFDELL